MVEGSIDVFHERYALLGEVRDEFLKSVVVKSRAREGNDVDVKPELSCKTVDYRSFPRTRSPILHVSG
jgi:hypothetical protein